MTLGLQAAAISQVQMARATDSGTMGEFRAALSAGSPPDQWVIVPQTTLEQYRQMISSLEVDLKKHQDYIQRLTTQHRYDLMTEGTDEPSEGMDAASAAVVNSLLSSVPDSSYYRDED